uniref:Protein Ycf2-like n=1 Tax=Steinernema glaseri TaxID=37863 RepID=A0A1I8AQN7_9BILA
MEGTDAEMCEIKRKRREERKTVVPKSEWKRRAKESFSKGYWSYSGVTGYVSPFASTESEKKEVNLLQEDNDLEPASWGVETIKSPEVPGLLEACEREGKKKSSIAGYWDAINSYISPFASTEADKENNIESSIQDSDAATSTKTILDESLDDTEVEEASTKTSVVGHWEVVSGSEDDEDTTRFDTDEEDAVIMTMAEAYANRRQKKNQVKEVGVDKEVES